MSLPREPRQKMINMMYLVLTALLALNVSAEIINAFKTVTKSLENTNTTVYASTETLMKSLEEKTKDSASSRRANIWYPKALEVQTKSREVYSYIQQLKDQLLKDAGGDPNNPEKKFKEDGQDFATRLMIKKGEGPKLLAALGKYKQEILAIDPAIDSTFATTLPINLDKPPSKNRAGRTWEGAYFHMVPTVAGLTILTKFQNDVRTTENRVIQFCHNKVGEVTVVFDTYGAFVGQSSNYLMPGQDLEVSAGLGAFSRKAKPLITINGTQTEVGDDGIAKMKLSGGGIGNHSVNVRIIYTNQETGLPDTVEKKVDYMVGQANASIALDKMNVLYIGVDNPVTIAASGGGHDKVKAFMSGDGGGSISPAGGAGKWVARVNNVTNDCKINVTVEGKTAGVSQFRVRTVPQSQAMVGAKESGQKFQAAAFRVQGGVGAGIKDFPFELQYTVVSYTLTVDTDEGDIATENATGNAFTGKVKQIIDRHVKSGKLVTIENIRVKGPDGRVLSAPSLLYYII